MELILDSNNNSVVDSGETLTGSDRGGATPDLISRALAAGIYYIRVYPYSSNDT